MKNGRTRDEKDEVKNDAEAKSGNEAENKVYHHVPVMINEALEYLNIKSGGYYIDGTLGGGGYTFELAGRAGKNGLVLAFDADELAIKNTEQKLEVLKDSSKNFSKIILSHANFRNLSKIIEENFPDADVKFDGIVFDLGLSSAQLEDQSRGFSFKVAEARLDMAFAGAAKVADQAKGKNLATTEEIVNSWPKERLAKILKEYGEERFAWKIADRIVEAKRKEFRGVGIRTVGELVKIIEDAVPRFYKQGKIHPATRTFQALRIATNDELNALVEVLPQASEALKPGGRLVVISYHSLEDRIVKNFFKNNQAVKKAKYEKNEAEVDAQSGTETNTKTKPALKILTKKVIVPTFNEIKNNPRARSAKLRAAERV